MGSLCEMCLKTKEKLALRKPGRRVAASRHVGIAQHRAGRARCFVLCCSRCCWCQTSVHLGGCKGKWVQRDVSSVQLPEVTGKESSVNPWLQHWLQPALWKCQLCCSFFHSAWFEIRLQPGSTPTASTLLYSLYSYHWLFSTIYIYENEH